MQGRQQSPRCCVLVGGSRGQPAARVSKGPGLCTERSGSCAEQSWLTHVRDACPPSHLARAASSSAWLVGGAAAAQLDGVEGGAAAAAAAATQQQQLRSCMMVYGMLQLAIGYMAVLQLAWWLERAARLAYLRRTGAASYLLL